MPKKDRVAGCRGRVGHLIAKRRECAHGGDADESEGAEAHGALSRLVDEVWLRNPRRAMREREREREISVLTQWGATLVIQLREKELALSLIGYITISLSHTHTQTTRPFKG